MSRKSASIESSWTVAEVLADRPAAAGVFCRYGMACTGCAMAPFETLAEVAATYELDLAKLLRQLNRVRASKARGGGARSTARR